MQEVLFRDRNLRYAEMLFTATQQQQIIMLLLELQGLSTETLRERKQRFQKVFEDSIRMYGAELYGDRYLPGAAQAEAERVRLEKLKQLDATRRDAERLKRVARWSE